MNYLDWQAISHLSHIVTICDRLGYGVCSFASLEEINISYERGCKGLSNEGIYIAIE